MTGKSKTELTNKDIYSESEKSQTVVKKQEEVVVEKELPCFEASGILAEFSN